jgi:putative ATP-dependent endonuclease of OLD family
MTLFNSLPKPVSVITDDDRFTDSKKPEFSFDKLSGNNYEALNTLYAGMSSGKVCSRAANLESFANQQAGIRVSLAYNTLEYEIAFHNVAKNKGDFHTNLFVEYIKETAIGNFDPVQDYYKSLPNDCLSEVQRAKLALLLWKMISFKAEFAQDFALHLVEAIEKTKKSGNQVQFTVPPYIVNALDHVRASGANSE